MCKMILSLYFKRYKKDTKGINPLNNPYVFENMFRGNPYIKEVSLHKETIYIEEKAFKDCVSLEKINIPPKVQYLTSKMFYGCVSLREIIVENPMPLSYYPKAMCCLSDAELHDNDKLLYFCVRIRNFFISKPDCFDGVDRKKCIIRVPKGSLNLYKEAREWKEFENIVEY